MTKKDEAKRVQSHIHTHKHENPAYDDVDDDDDCTNN
jgi:hypothetical protein